MARDLESVRKAVDTALPATGPARRDTVAPLARPWRSLAADIEALAATIDKARSA